MRFQKTKPLSRINYLQKGLVCKFLWLPKEINHEIRWLEKVTFEQEVNVNFYPVEHYYWKDKQWVDK